MFNKEALWEHTAIAVAGGKILTVGTDAEAVSSAGPDTEVIDAHGNSILPGFIDSHLHATMCAELYLTKLIYDITREEQRVP